MEALRASSSAPPGRCRRSSSPRRSSACTPACVYLTPLFGGLLADRVLGRTKTVVIGASLMALGHFLMAFEASFLLAISAACCSASAASRATSRRRSATSTRRATSVARARSRSSCWRSRSR
jgi:MFS family permease